jgi:hypothetical protein
MVCTALLSAAFATVAKTPRNRMTDRIAVRYFMGISRHLLISGVACH